MRETDTQLHQEIERSPEYASELAEPNGGRHEGAWLYVWMAWEQRPFLARCAAVGCIASLILALVLPARYEAVTRLMPPDSTGGLSSMAMMADKVSSLSENPMVGQYASELLGAKNTGALFIGVLGSRTVKDRIIDKFDLRRVYWVKHYDSARKKLEEKTTIMEEKKSGILVIVVTDRNPLRAAAIAQEYVSQLNILMSQLTTSKAHRERVFLEDRLQLAKQELDAAAKDLGEYSSKNATFDVQDEGRAIVEAAAALQGELVAAQSEVKGLEQIYTSNNVRVKSLHARISELESKLNQIGGTKGISTGSAQDTALKTNGDFLYPSLRQLPILGVRYGDLYLRAKITEKVYEVLTQQYELARVEEAKAIPTVRVLDPAISPERRSGPSRLFTVLIGVLLAVVGGIAWITAKREWDNWDPADPRKVFALEAYGVTARGLASSRVVSYFRNRKLGFLDRPRKTD